MPPEILMKERQRRHAALAILRDAGFYPLGGWLFDKNGLTYDMRAADLTQLSKIEAEGLFVVDVFNVTWQAEETRQRARLQTWQAETLDVDEQEQAKRLLQQLDADKAVVEPILLRARDTNRQVTEILHNYREQHDPEYY